MSAGYGPHAEELHGGLLKAFPDSGRLEGFTWFRLNVNLKVVATGNLSDQVRELMMWAESEGRERELIEKALEAKPGAKLLKAASKNVLAHLDEVDPTPWYQAPSPFETCFVRGGHAFVNRAGLRDGLKVLTTETGGFKSLIVSGASGSGRTYSRRLIEHLAERLDSYRLVPIDLSEVDANYGPNHLARVIANRVGRSKALETMPTQEAAGRWGEELAAWVAGEVEHRGGTWWVVIDGLDNKDLRDETLDLVMQLVHIAEQATTCLRLILLGWSSPLQGDLDDWVCTEEIKAIERDTLEDFFSQFMYHKNIETQPGAAEQAAKDVLKIVPNQGPTRMKELRKAVGHVARSLAPPPGANGA